MNRPARFAIRFACLLALPAVTGCSFLFVTPPPSSGGYPIAARPGRCTSSKLAPAVDTVFGSLEVLRTGLAASADDDVYKDAAISREADIGLGLAFTTLFLSSAIYGFYETSACADRKAGHYVEPDSDDNQVDADDSFTPEHPSPRAPSAPEPRPGARATPTSPAPARTTAPEPAPSPAPTDEVAPDGDMPDGGI
jgi:hypothetical protein